MMYLVTRRGPGRNETKSYGPFAERAVADMVALRAVEKHVGSSVTVAPQRDPKPAHYSAHRAQETSR